MVEAQSRPDALAGKTDPGLGTIYLGPVLLVAEGNLIALERLNLQEALVDLEVSGNDEALAVIVAPILTRSDQHEDRVRIRSIDAERGTSLGCREVIAVGSFNPTRDVISDPVGGLEAGGHVTSERRVGDRRRSNPGEIDLRSMGKLGAGESWPGRDLHSG